MSSAYIYTAPADYIVTGSWSEKAVAEARKYSTNINVAASGKGPNGYTSVPPVAEWRLNPEARYVYYCANETIDGVELDAVPDTKVRGRTHRHASVGNPDG